MQEELASALALRSRAMTWLLGLSTVNVVVILFLAPQIGLRIVPTALPGQALFGLLGLLWVLEAGVFRWIRSTGRTSVRHPVLEQAISVVEVSAVSIFIGIAAWTVDPPVAAILGPASWFYFPLVAISILTLKPQVVLVTGVVATVQFLGLALWISGPSGPDGPPMPLLMTGMSFHAQKVLMLLVTTGIAASVCWELRRRMRRVAVGARERDRILDLFGQHTAPEVVQTLVESGGVIPPERREVGILFLDIRGFTSLSERLPPEEVVARLDAFFELVLPCVTANGGIVHQLLGDGFMAIFGAPNRHDDDARRALRTAIEIHETVRGASAEGRIPDTDVVMGVHWGEVVAGPVGAADHKEYKVTGDAVNLAARLETMAKDLDATILTSRAAVTAAGMAEEVREDLGDLEIRGRVRPLRVLRLR